MRSTYENAPLSICNAPILRPYIERSIRRAGPTQFAEMDLAVPFPQRIGLHTPVVMIASFIGRIVVIAIEQALK